MKKKNEAAQALNRLRNKKLGKKRRSEIARKAAKTRWQLSTASLASESIK